MKALLEKILNNTFVTGLFLALSVVLADVLNTFILDPSHPWSWAGVIVAVGIATAGYVGQFFSGSANTTLALLGSAIAAIVPLLSSGDIDWRIVAATFLLKFLGLKTAGFKASTSVTKQTTEQQFYNNARL
jgi:hypothetical protein